MHARALRALLKIHVIRKNVFIYIFLGPFNVVAFVIGDASPTGSDVMQSNRSLSTAIAYQLSFPYNRIIHFKFTVFLFDADYVLAAEAPTGTEHNGARCAKDSAQELTCILKDFQ